MPDYFHRLAPFIQEYIYNEGWTELRPIQREACHVLFETDAHLLVAAGTASGKTEAAFLPILTLLHENPSKTVGAIYVGPIKALINDQCDRLTDLLRHQPDLPVWAWHGDIGQGVKKRLVKDPKGILQITPESLESLLINKHAELSRLFGDLRFVVIDEIHAFIGSDRGAQILCQLARLAKITGNQPRRIGLSATLGDYGLAEDWLRSGTKQSVITPQVASNKRTIHLALEHFYDSGIRIRAKGESRDEAFNPCYLHLFKQSLNRKCLIFANGRMETEAVITELRQIAQAKSAPDIYHVHHGSISAELREAAETAMRDTASPTVTAATVTFEMGIDLGKLDRVIQLEAPASVSSFLQRLGRSGRRGSPADMRFVCVEDKPDGSETLPQLLPWQLLQCIAIIQLYLEEKWIEPIAPQQYPFSLLYHQTMSTLAARGELSAPQLAQQILTLPPFQSISQDDFRELLRHLISIDHIQQTKENGLILGLEGEKLARNFKFYAIFPDNEEFAVWADGVEVGTIVVPPQVGDKLSLAGRTWEVLEVDQRRKTIQARISMGAATVSWRGSGGNIHTRLLQRMRQVLLEDKEYAYLQPGAKARLAEARQLAQKEGIDSRQIFSLEEGYACILPWLGSTEYRTLERFLRMPCREALGTKGVSGRSPYYFVVNLGKAKLEQLYWEIKSLGDRRLDPEELLTEDEAPKLQKYDEFVPPQLLRKAFLTDYLNLPQLAQNISHW
ncbi:MAG TPA: DEAD/DEAH box helicase [Leptolyngbyaceae cyanobacterium M33_DOE_097]|uniref:DEAD/DEAH box helicase n=1 Tax=Oscillatoriales cyanobacterium SpSt-418 TaxID=2282169 RepID=A0A7C3PLX3_9CYAN|nr:DEAD/DEAH box helicase [Leptolyngbyaceae cyanobacterium M33_DOE_097]